MSKQVLYKQLEEYNKTLARYRKRFLANDGKIDKNEQALLDKVSAKIRQIQKTLNITVINDEEGEVIEVPVTRGLPGIQFEQQIVNMLQEFTDAIQNYWQNYHIAINNFNTTMEFASNQEAEAKHLEVVFKAIAKKVFEEGLKQVGKKMGGPWGEIIDGAKSAVEAWASESERVAAAAGQVKVRDYIVSVRNGIPQQRDKMLAAVEAKKRPLIEHFQKVAAGRISKDGRVIGEPAQMLIDLAAQVAAFKKSMPKPEYFQKQFSTQFANTPGRSDYVSHGGVLTGIIYFDVYLEVDPTADEPWKKGKMGEAWRLVTKAPNPDRVADSLKQSLDGKKPWQIDLPKMVKMSILVEEDWAPDRVQEGYIRFTKSPDQFEVRSNYSEKWFKEAWLVDGIRKQILEVDDLKGSSE